MNPTTPSNNPIPNIFASTSESLTHEKASTLMRLGMSGPRRPVDDLIDRLSESDASRWLLTVLEAGPVRGMGSPVELLANGKASLAQLETIKERSKANLKSNIDSEMRLGGIAGYFLSLAASLRHYGKSIGGRERDELNSVLLDLAAVAPAPFSKLLSEAAFVKIQP